MSPHHRQQQAERHWQAGVQQAKAQRWLPAAKEFEAATRLAPQQTVYWLNLSRALARAGDFNAALNHAKHALEIEPGSAVARLLVSQCLMHFKRHAEACDCLAALPEGVTPGEDYLLAFGKALWAHGQAQRAIEVLFQCLALRVDNAEAHYGLGLCFMDLNLRSEASECFRTATLLDDGEVRASALSLLVHESRHACDWGTLAADTQALMASLPALASSSQVRLAVFPFLALDISAAQLKTVAALTSRASSAGITAMPARAWVNRPRLRLGFLSGDMLGHATVVLMIGLLEQLDREHFEVFIYSHSRDDGTALRQRVVSAAEHFIEVGQLSHAQTAQQMRADGIDILIDLKGHTRDTRFEILAYRPAPIQATFLGFPGTTGAPFIDYIIGDAMVTPLHRAADFSEHIAQLPHSYQPNDSLRVRPTPVSRAQAGLPEGAVVLCAFNQAYKVSPFMLDLWAQVLAQAPQTVLWLLRWNPASEGNLLRELAQRGVDLSRVIFADKLSLDDHLARLPCADVFLDTWPCNAHTTASEALWVGLPVLTVPGETFASRVASSLLSACGLGELICPTPAAYVAQAVALAQDAAKRQQLRRHLLDQAHTLPLFDTARYTRDFEHLLRRMAARAAAGQKPAALPAEVAGAVASKLEEAGDSGLLTPLVIKGGETHYQVSNPNRR